MMKKVVIIVEKASDGKFWCRTETEIGDTVLTSVGDSVAQAKEDLMDCYAEAKADAEENNMKFDDVKF